MNIAILDDYQRIARTLADWDRLPAGTGLDVFHQHIADRDALVAALLPFDVLVIMRERTPFPADLIERLPNLRLLVTTGMRNLSIDLDACRARGITVCGTAIGGTPTAELAWGLILALVKRIPAEDRALRAGSWQTGLTGTLTGKRLGVVGLGKLGAQVARIGLAFGMDVVAWSQNLTDERAREVGVRRAEKRDLFATADVVSLHLVLGERTRGIVGADELRAMKPTAYFINTARAGLVDEAALIEALREKRIAGAGLDVFSAEPLPPDHPLRTLDGTVLTPHLGYVTEENYAVFYREALEDILAWTAGQPVRVLAAP
ncbi:MAG TPA: D-2-hydroxyacid dehydrogenase family protein [Azospirillum sp.]|nr:D-2-hydroxyacid dehydrogenase family protein [Azospirillum sp.]